MENLYISKRSFLDNHKLREWFDLLTDDVRYWMPIRHNLLEATGKFGGRSLPNPANLLFR